MFKLYIWMTLFISFLLSQSYHITHAASIFALNDTATDDHDRIKHSLYLNH